MFYQLKQSHLMINLGFFFRVFDILWKYSISNTFELSMIEFIYYVL